MKNWFKTNTDSSPKDKKWWKPNISWLKLDKWVKRLDIYIIKKFLGTYFFAIALIISIAVVFDVNENIDRFINNKAPLKLLHELHPLLLQSVQPLVCLYRCYLLYFQAGRKLGNHCHVLHRNEF